MKKNIMLFGAALMAAALVCCSKDLQETTDQAASQDGYMITIEATMDEGPEARTMLDPDDYHRVNWIHRKEQVRLFEIAEGVMQPVTTDWGRLVSKADGTTPETGDIGREMTFQVWVKDRPETTGPFTYYGVYPNTCIAQENDIETIDLKLPVKDRNYKQVLSVATSFDEVADRLIAIPVSLEERATSSKKLQFRFKRVVAVGRMILKSLPSSEAVASVTFKAPGKALSGVSRFDLTKGEAVQYGVSEASDEVVLDCSAISPTADGELPLYFTCWPFELAAGETFSVTVTTASQSFVRTVTIPEGRPIAFQEGRISSFSVNVNDVLDFDAAALSGAVLPEGTAEYPLVRTVESEIENKKVFAGVLDLTAGKMTVPVRSGDKTYYLKPAAGVSETDGEPVAFAASDKPYEWTIAAEGRHRVVVDFDKRTVAVYSPEKDLQPKVVEWRPNDDKNLPLIRTEVTKFGVVGAVSWSGKAIDFTQSLADPQIFIYSGTAIGGRTKFTIVGPEGIVVDGTTYKISQAYCFTAPLVNGKKVDDAPISHKTWMPLEGGSDQPHKDTYYGLPSGTNFIILDLRNMRIYTTKR